MRDIITPKPFSLIPPGADKNQRSRLRKYEQWVADTGRSLLAPDLAAYRDELLQSLARSSVSSHLSTIRATYDRLLLERTLFFSYVPADLSFGERKAFVDEAIAARISNGIHPRRSPIRVTAKQDRVDREQLRLTPGQARMLVNGIDISHRRGLRDVAVIGLMLCTGLRESEVVALQVDDLRQRVDGVLALLVRAGKGNKQRFVPYGQLSVCLVMVDKWPAEAGISTGVVFRSLTRGGKIKEKALSTRDIERTLKRYSLTIEGELRYVRPHDLRRTYAKTLYNAGQDIVAIQQNLGHARLETTLGYIGDVDIDWREPTNVFDFDIERFL